MRVDARKSVQAGDWRVSVQRRTAVQSSTLHMHLECYIQRSELPFYLTHTGKEQRSSSEGWIVSG